MDNGNNDPLAELGLNLDNAAPAGSVLEAINGAAAMETREQPVQQQQAKAVRTEVKIGAQELGEAGDLPAFVRGGGGKTGSKYKLDEIPAPVQDKKTKKWSYVPLNIKPAEGEDADKLRRSVQSAVTQANKTAKDAGEKTYYATRSTEAGIAVYRVDDTLETAAE